MKFSANFDRALKSVIPDIGVIPVAVSACGTELTGLRFRSAAKAVHAAAHFLIDNSIVCCATGWIGDL